ncbi:MAG: hypothetical protein ACFFBP_23050 [Promethearchaeota archaeon]
MTKFLKRRAKKLNLLSLPKTTLFGTGRRARSDGNFINTYVPDTVYAIKKFLKYNDGSTVKELSRATRNKNVYILAPNIDVFVDIECHVKGMNIHKGSNHIIKIDIYSDDIEFIKGIANAIDNKFPRGILSHIKWDKMMKVFKVDKEHVIASWNAIL